MAEDPVDVHDFETQLARAHVQSSQTSQSEQIVPEHLEAILPLGGLVNRKYPVIFGFKTSKFEVSSPVAGINSNCPHPSPPGVVPVPTLATDHPGKLVVVIVPANVGFVRILVTAAPVVITAMESGTENFPRV